MAEFSNDEDNINNTPYDLRQIYARLVGVHLEKVATWRMMSNFPNWFRALEDLYTITKFKFDEPKTANKTYLEKRGAVSQIANKNSAVWKSKPDAQRNQHSVYEIEDALRELESFIYDEMQNAGLFGKGYEYDEEEI